MGAQKKGGCTKGSCGGPGDAEASTRTRTTSTAQHTKRRWGGASATSPYGKYPTRQYYAEPNILNVVWSYSLGEGATLDARTRHKEAPTGCRAAHPRDALGEQGLGLWAGLTKPSPEALIPRVRPGRGLVWSRYVNAARLVAPVLEHNELSRGEN